LLAVAKESMFVGVGIGSRFSPSFIGFQRVREPFPSGLSTPSPPAYSLFTLPVPSYMLSPILTGGSVLFQITD